MSSIHWDDNAFITVAVGIVILCIVFRGIEDLIRAWRGTSEEEEE